ncbi:hypothetical protein NPX13_g9932 [Xylaria arbuscula]|uniref:NmrA-like domain-containing protein n=1 Tax=Xylaria arbuscula TaxID=114810 RepID=A0A9W8N605_9PEZI|nr:hypothetical protein NPX13_g9932 [Xylaria arbuscula]
MVKVAVAGGSDSIGKAIVQAIEKDASHEVIILSRQRRAEDPNVVTIDFLDIDSLQSVLETHEVHTVISAVSLQSEASGQSQMNLIDAASRSRCTRRFMPSEFGANYKPEHLAALPLYAWKFKAADRLETAGLEYTRLSNGMFMDYWFASRIPSAFRVNASNWIDLDNHYAVIPGDGRTPFVLTHSRDVARFVVAVLGLPRWEKRYYLIGDRLTMNDFVRIAEKTSGHSFEKHSDGVDELLSGRCTLVPAARKMTESMPDPALLVGMVAGAGAMVAQGGMDLPDEPSLNKLFPSLKTLTVQEALQIYYAKL